MAIGHSHSFMNLKFKDIFPLFKDFKSNSRTNGKFENLQNIQKTFTASYRNPQYIEIIATGCPSHVLQNTGQICNNRIFQFEAAEVDFFQLTLKFKTYSPTINKA